MCHPVQIEDFEAANCHQFDVVPISAMGLPLLSLALIAGNIHLT